MPQWGINNTSVGRHVCKYKHLCENIIQWPCEKPCTYREPNLKSQHMSQNTLHRNTRFGEITKRVTKNLNRVIDRNYYPVKEAENSNMRHRPVGLGVQGLADTFIKLRLPFRSLFRFFGHLKVTFCKKNASFCTF